MVDTGRPSLCCVGEALRLEVIRAEIPQRSVSTLAIVKHLDVEVNAPLRLLPGAIAVTARPFVLQLAEETFGGSVVPTVALAAHALCDVEEVQAIAERVGRILTATVAVKEEIARRSTMRDGHIEGFHDDAGSHVVVHRPADDLAREQVDHHGQVEPAFVGADVGDVGNPLLVRPRGREIAILRRQLDLPSQRQLERLGEGPSQQHSPHENRLVRAGGTSR